MNISMLKYGVGGIAIGAFIMMSSLRSESTEKTVVLNENEGNLPQVVRAPYLDKQFTWAGEVMPPTDDARERIDRELITNSYYHTSTVQAIKLANRYFPVIETILLEEGVPDDFKYLAVAESGLRNVTSPARAKGIWQFLEASAEEYGLEVNKEVDERYHVEKATRAACKYLKYLKNRFGNWTLASAAYNMGPTALARELRNQGENNYYDLNLNHETQRYVFRLLALKEIIGDPERFGFFIYPEEKYQPLNNYYEVVVDESVKNWGDWAEQHGITYRQLKRYNPWLRTSQLTVIKNTYKIKVPRG